MQVHFWGVRGSIPVSGERFVKYGGNTTCVVFEHNDEFIIIDGGTGLKAFGDFCNGKALNATLAFTHVHWDHIQGLPFFGPAFNPGSNIQVRGVSRDGWHFNNILSLQMTPPTFPITLDILGGIKGIEDFEVDKAYQIGSFTVQALEQNHPDGVVVYRVEAGGYKVVFATDVEHGGEGLDSRLVELCKDCDLIIHDAQYTEDEYYGRNGPPRKGWGHSMWKEAVQLAIDSNSKRLALFHHDPSRSDEGVEQIEAEAQALFSGTFASREHTTFDLESDSLLDAKGVKLSLGAAGK
jgi:phosphoribosyl 1,2-cyclic phosphodiesterase